MVGDVLSLLLPVHISYISSGIVISWLPPTPGEKQSVRAIGEKPHGPDSYRDEGVPIILR